MPRESVVARTRVVLLSESALSLVEIKKRLEEEEIFVSKTSIYLLLKKFKEKRTVRDLRWYRPPTHLSQQQLDAHDLFDVHSTFQSFDAQSIHDAAAHTLSDIQLEENKVIICIYVKDGYTTRPF